MSKHTLIILFIVLIVCVMVLFFFKAKAQPTTNTNKGGKGNPAPVVDNSKTDLSYSRNTVWPLQTGSQGAAVRVIQIFSGATIDGQWGPGTETAVNTTWADDNIGQDDFIKYCITPASGFSDFPLKPGSTGLFVEALQSVLGLDETGTWDATLATALNGMTDSNGTISVGTWTNIMNKQLSLGITPNTTPSDGTHWWNMFL